MKLLCLIAIILFSSTAIAEDFTRYLEKNIPTKIQILEKEKMHVNDNCFNNFETCTQFLKKTANNKISKGNKHNLTGHPAGAFCTNSQGMPEIFFDVKNNQYDFCNFNEKYIVDAWDFYNRFNK